MFLQKQPFFQKLFTKQKAWLARACSTDSIDIKFVIFGRVDQKLCNLQNWKSNRSNLSFKSTTSHVAVSYWAVPIRVDRAIQTTGLKGACAAQINACPFAYFLSYPSDRDLTALSAPTISWRRWTLTRGGGSASRRRR